MKFYRIPLKPLKLTPNIFTNGVICEGTIKRLKYFFIKLGN
jgi:hypothetical protein